MAGRTSKYLITGVLMALIAISALPVAGVAESVAPTTPVGDVEGNASVTTSSNVTVSVNFSKVAEIMISKTESLLAWVQGTIQNYGITLPGKLNASLSRAEELLANATALLDEHPKEALAEAFKATHALMPVVQYVGTAIPPQYRDELTAWRLQEALRIRERVMADLQRTFQYLENRSVTVPPQIREEVLKAQQLLQQARQELSSGNVSGAEALLKQADRLMAQVRAQLARGFAAKWRAVVAADAALKHLGFATMHMVLLMNRSLTMLEGNHTAEAQAALTGLAKLSGDMLARIRFIEGRVNATSGVPQEILNSTEYVVSTIHNTSLQALQALKAGNITAAIAVLQEGLSSIRPALSNLTVKARWEHGRLKWIEGLMTKLRQRAEEAMHHWIGKMGKGVFPHRPTVVEGLRRAFEGLKHAFRAGWISNETYRNALTNLQEKMQKIMNSSNVPALIKQGLRQLMNEVSHELSNLTSGTASAG
ncbi:MAG: hypothetical protein J7L55_05200 [Desulfurococcales archaeon]|nr:hypothetical protein [Desulfurococcales archaeon]